MQGQGGPRSRNNSTTSQYDTAKLLKNYPAHIPVQQQRG